MSDISLHLKNTICALFYEYRWPINSDHFEAHRVIFLAAIDSANRNHQCRPVDTGKKA
jgi:hypothetical protein